MPDRPIIARLLGLNATLGEDQTCGEMIQAKYNCTAEYCHDLVPGYLNYLEFFYCYSTNAGAQAGIFILLVVWMAFCLHLVETTTNDFFCASLTLAVDALKLSPNVAGVTFLAVGNAACDVIASIAAFATNSPKVGVGTTLGAGIFVTGAVIAAVSFVADVRLARRSFVRDVMFFIITVVYLLAVALDGIITLAEATGFVVIYVVFVIVVGAGRYISKVWGEEEGAQGPSVLGAGEDAAVPPKLADADKHAPGALTAEESSATFNFNGEAAAAGSAEQRDMVAALDAARTVAGSSKGGKGGSRADLDSETRRLAQSHLFAAGGGVDAAAAAGPLRPQTGDSDDESDEDYDDDEEDDDVTGLRPRAPGQPPPPRGEVEFHGRSKTGSFIEDLPLKPSRWTRAFLRTQGARAREAPALFAPFHWTSYHKKRLARELAKRLQARGASRITTPDGRSVDFLDLLASDEAAAGELAAAIGSSVTAAATRTAGGALTFGAAAAAAASGAAAGAALAETGAGASFIPAGAAGRQGRSSSMTSASSRPMTALTAAKAAAAASGKGGSAAAGATAPAHGTAVGSTTDYLAVLPHETIKPTADLYIKFKTCLGYVYPAYHAFMHTCEQPVTLARKLTVPVMHEGAYRRRLLCLAMPGCLTFCVLIVTTHILKMETYEETQVGGVPYWAIAFAAGVVLGAVLHFVLPVKRGPHKDKGLLESKADLLGSVGSKVALGESAALLPAGAKAAAPAAGHLGGAHSDPGDSAAAAAHHHAHKKRAWYKKIGLVLAGPNDHPVPTGPLFTVMLVVSFVLALFWLLVIATEIVGTAIFMGKVLGIPDVVMGLTVLAVGNSINDLAASLTIARDGYASMAVAGAYAGPMFNILAGIGLPMLMYTAQNESHEYAIGEPTLLVWLSYGALLVMLVVTLVWVPFEGWRITHRIGRFLCAWFFLFIILVVVIGMSGLSKGDVVSLG